MKKILVLLKTTLKGELNIFKIKALGKLNYLFIIWLLITCLFTSYTYASTLMSPLYKLELSYIAISLFQFVVVIMTIIEGIYKSSGIIFEAKDNDLLFSMPINKSSILISRFIKILLWNYLTEIIILVPCLVKYSILIKPDISFYLISFLSLILLPLIPLVISSIISYIIKTISIKFKNKKLAQTLLTLIFFIAVLFISMSIEKIFNNIVESATSINDLITKIYLPIGLYIELITNFNIYKLITLILISIIPFILFIIIFSKNYDKIINYNKETFSKNKKQNIKQTTIIKSLTIKEIKNYFGSPIYIINTIFAPLMIILFSIMLLVKFDDILTLILTTFPNLNINDIYNLSSYLYIALILILLSLSTITACSISLESTNLELLKSLPIKETNIFLAKLLLNDIIIIPPFIIGAIIYIIKFKILNINLLYILIACLLLPHLNGEVGLLINLMFPKLDYNSEAEVVKQSIAVFITIIINLLLSLIIIYSFYKLINIINNLLLVTIYIIILVILTISLNKLLNTYGIKRLKEIN